MRVSAPSTHFQVSSARLGPGLSATADDDSRAQVEKLLFALFELLWRFEVARAATASIRAIDTGGGYGRERLEANR